MWCRLPVLFATGSCKYRQKHIAHKSMYRLQTILLLQKVWLEAFIFFFKSAHKTSKVHLINVPTEQFNAPQITKCWMGFLKKDGGNVWHKGTDLIMMRRCAFTYFQLPLCCKSYSKCAHSVPHVPANMSECQTTETWKTDSWSTQLVVLICRITQLSQQC